MSIVSAIVEAENHLKSPISDVVEEHWQEWSFVMRALLGGERGRSPQLLGAAEAADMRDPSNTRIQALMGDEGLQANKKMYVARHDNQGFDTDDPQRSGETQRNSLLAGTL